MIRRRAAGLAGAGLLMAVVLGTCEPNEAPARDVAGPASAPASAARLDTLYAAIEPLTAALRDARDALDAYADALEAMRRRPRAAPARRTDS